MQSCFSFKIKEKQFCIKLLRQRFDQRIFDSWFLPRWATQCIRSMDL